MRCRHQYCGSGAARGESTRAHEAYRSSWQARFRQSACFVQLASQAYQNRLGRPEVAFTCRAVSQSAGVQAAPSWAASHRPFLEWLANHGATGMEEIGGTVAVQDCGAGQRGVVSVQDQKRGAHLFTVPLALDMAVDEFGKEPHAPQLAMAHWSVRLTARLLREARKGQGSRWAPYLKVLNETEPGNGSISFPAAALPAAEDRSVPEDVEALHAFVSEAHSRGQGPATGDASAEGWHQAFTTVMSRALGVTVQQGGENRRLCRLVPFVDLVNHAGDVRQPAAGRDQPLQYSATNIELRREPGPDADQLRSVAVALKDIKAGEQLFFSYGPRPSRDFLLTWGFLPAWNAHDDVILFADVTEAVRWLIAILQGADMPDFRHADGVGNGSLFRHRLHSLSSSPTDKTVRQRQHQAHVKVGRTGLVDKQIQDLFEEMAPAGCDVAAFARQALAVRCLQLLSQREPLHADLARLAEHEAQMSSSDGGQAPSGAWQAIKAQYEEVHSQLPILKATCCHKLLDGCLETASAQLMQAEACASPPLSLHDHGPHQVLAYRAQQKLILWTGLLHGFAVGNSYLD